MPDTPEFECHSSDFSGPDLSAVKQEACLGALRFLKDGGRPESTDLSTAAEGQVVREVGLIAGDEMFAAVEAGVDLALDHLRSGRLSPVGEHRKEGPALHDGTPERRFFLNVLVPLGIRQSPQALLEDYAAHLYKGFSSVDPAALDKFRVVKSLRMAREERHGQKIGPFHRQIEAALTPEQVQELERLDPG